MAAGGEDAEDDVSKWTASGGRGEGGVGALHLDVSPEAHDHDTEAKGKHVILQKVCQGCI